MFCIGEVLGAEAAADVGRDEAHVLRFDTQGARHMVSIDVDVLARGMKRVAAAGRVELPDAAARLHWVRDDAMVVERQGDDVRCPGEGRIGAGGIAGVPVDADIARHFVGDQRRPARLRRLTRRDGGQRLVVDRYEFGRVERLGMALRDDQRHRLAGKARLAAGHQRLGREGERLAGLHIGLGIGAERAEPVGGRIDRREDRQHARRGSGGVDLDGMNPRMGMRRAQDDGVRQPIERQIVEIGAAAGDEARILPSLGRIADRGFRHVLSFSAFSACRFSSHQSLACSFQ